MNLLEYATPPASDLLSDLGRRIIGAEDADTLRENANLNGDSFSGKMSRLGSETAKWHALRHVLPEELAASVENGDLYVHDLDQYALGTTNCIFIPF
ncbi:anaerobic ribonucleoside-triphosphate reductase [Paenibacillus sp. PvP094]